MSAGKFWPDTLDEAIARHGEIQPICPLCPWAECLCFKMNQENMAPLIESEKLKPADCFHYQGIARVWQKELGNPLPKDWEEVRAGLKRIYRKGAA